MSDIEVSITCRCGNRAAVRIMAARLDIDFLAEAVVEALKNDGWEKTSLDEWRCRKCSGVGGRVAHVLVLEVEG